MRHRVYGKHLGRNKDQRKALFTGLVYSLISSGTIQTSKTKATAIKGLVDRIITLAKDKNSQSQLQSLVSDKNLRERLVKEIVPKLGARTSGYSSIVKLGTRPGDRTMMVRMSLLGAEELKPIEKESRVPPKARPAEGGKSQESSKTVAQSEKKEVKEKPTKRTTKTTTAKRGGKKS